MTPLKAFPRNSRLYLYTEICLISYLDIPREQRVEVGLEVDDRVLVVRLTYYQLMTLVLADRLVFEI